MFWIVPLATACGVRSALSHPIASEQLLLFCFTNLCLTFKPTTDCISFIIYLYISILCCCLLLLPQKFWPTDLGSDRSWLLVGANVTFRATAERKYCNSFFFFLVNNNNSSNLRNNVTVCVVIRIKDKRDENYFGRQKN